MLFKSKPRKWGLPQSATDSRAQYSNVPCRWVCAAECAAVVRTPAACNCDLVSEERAQLRSLICRPPSMLISPSTMPALNRSSGPNPPTLFWPNSTDALYQMFESVHKRGRLVRHKRHRNSRCERLFENRRSQERADYPGRGQHLPTRDRGSCASTLKVLEAAAVGIPDPRLGERVCACIVPRPGQNLSFEVCALA
jgi:hypothetical protein